MASLTRRLFFALWPDDRTRQALFHWQTHNLPADVRWQHRADLHMTLHFLGQIDTSLLEPLRVLGAETAGERFDLVLDRVGHWRKSRILWARPSCVPDELPRLHARIETGLNALGIEAEARTYKPHVTLARKVRGQPAVQSLEPLNWPVCELALVESRSGEVPMYHPVGRWPLD